MCCIVFLKNNSWDHFKIPQNMHTNKIKIIIIIIITDVNKENAEFVGAQLHRQILLSLEEEIEDLML